MTNIEHLRLLYNVITVAKFWREITKVAKPIS